MNQLQINIGLFGCISVGKTTFLNAISGKHYSDTEIKKTTMVPQAYMETADEELTNTVIIRRDNRKANECALKAIEQNQFSLHQCQPIYHSVDRVCDLFDPLVIDRRIKINIYDIPGLNDSVSKNVYFEWVKQNIKNFDIIIFITDITKGLNNSDEIDVLGLLFDCMSPSARMVCLINKCDDIYFDPEQNDLVFEEKEQENIYIQANNILVDVAKSHNCDKEKFTPFIPISSENCFIYRALKNDPTCELDANHQNRLCKNSCGTIQWKKMNQDEKESMFRTILTDLEKTYESKILDTGYITVKNIIQSVVLNNKSAFIMNHIDNEMKELAVTSLENIPEYIVLVNKFSRTLAQIEAVVGEVSYDIFWQNIKMSIINYVNAVTKLNTKILRRSDFIEFNEFNTMHTNLQNYCLNFSSLADTLCKIKNYPADFVKGKEEQLVAKLLHIYDQFSLVDVADQTHISPENLLLYLQIIDTYAPYQFDKYAKQFLGFNCNNPKLKIIPIEKDLIALVEYISRHTKTHAIMVQQICTLLVNKQQQMSAKPIEQYFNYLVQLKRWIRYKIELFPDEYTYYLNILYEMTDKNVSTMLGVNSMSNIYKQEIDYQKIHLLLSKTIIPEYTDDIHFEKYLISIIPKKLN